MEIESFLKLEEVEERVEEGDEKEVGFEPGKAVSSSESISNSDRNCDSRDEVDVKWKDRRVEDEIEVEVEVEGIIEGRIHRLLPSKEELALYAIMIGLRLILDGNRVKSIEEAGDGNRSSGGRDEKEVQELLSTLSPLHSPLSSGSLYQSFSPPVASTQPSSGRFSPGLSDEVSRNLLDSTFKPTLLRSFPQSW